jgi:DNA primase
MEAPPTDEDRVDRNFADNIRRIREKWYKEQKRLVQLQLRQAQEQGDDKRIVELTCRKQDLMKEEQALR